MHFHVSELATKLSSLFWQLLNKIQRGEEEEEEEEDLFFIILLSTYL